MTRGPARGRPIQVAPAQRPRDELRLYGLGHATTATATPASSTLLRQCIFEVHAREMMLTSPVTKPRNRYTIAE